MTQSCWTTLNREAICSGENEKMGEVAGKEDMWDSGCIESYESESAAEEKEKLASGFSSTTLNEGAKKTYAEVCRGKIAASSSNDDKGDLAEAESTTEEGESRVSLLFCGESLKIVEDLKNDGDEAGDDGRAAVDVVSVVATPSVTSDLTVEDAKDNIDECEGGGHGHGRQPRNPQSPPPPPPPPSGSISGRQQQGGQESPKAASKYSKSRKRRDKKQQRRSVLQRNRREWEKEDEDEEDDDVQSDDESSQNIQDKVLYQKIIM